MRFRHKKHRNVLLHTPFGKLDFKDWEAETDNPELVKALSRHPDIEALDQEDPEPAASGSTNEAKPKPRKRRKSE